jgi:hypothetical protein
VTDSLVQANMGSFRETAPLPGGSRTHFDHYELFGARPGKGGGSKAVSATGAGGHWMSQRMPKDWGKKLLTPEPGADPRIYREWDQRKTEKDAFAKPLQTNSGLYRRQYSQNEATVLAANRNSCGRRNLSLLTPVIPQNVEPKPNPYNLNAMLILPQNPTTAPAPAIEKRSGQAHFRHSDITSYTLHMQRLPTFHGGGGYCNQGTVNGFTGC